MSDYESSSSAAHDSEQDIEHSTLTHINSKEIRAQLETKLAELGSLRSLPSASSRPKKKAQSHSSFIDWLSMTTNEPVLVPNVHEDLAREMAFYEAALASARRAKSLVEAETGSFFPPAEYVPLMLKTKEHMGKIERKLQAEAEALAAKEEARRQRSLKKFGKQVQTETLKTRQTAKSQAMGPLKKKSKSVHSNTHDEFESSKFAADGEFDIHIDSDSERHGRRSRPDAKRGARKAGSGLKRKQRDEKYGFGGKKIKGNTRKSHDDISGFDPVKNKAPFRGVQFKRSKDGRKSTASFNRPGKARREQSRRRQASK